MTEPTDQPPTPTALRPRPELLSPAGDRECLVAAVENGADAVYFGLQHGFNARARATNLTLEELPEVMSLLRCRGVRGYVTLNTLVFADELPAAERTVVALTEAGVDAVLVQDLGLARLVRAMSPDLAVHASTQMTLTSAESVRVAERLGVRRVVLGREVSIDEIRKVRAATDVELETFVHGALCVAYSGQCLTSESLGGRSANRGQCAQACRLPYDLVCDGRDVPLGDKRYLLSPQDLAAYHLTADLIDAGVGCLKIEGRLKTPEYVANVTQHYRRAIDAALAGRPIEFTADEVEGLELSFSRGFSSGWLKGCDHKELVPATSSAKRGVAVGEVVRARAGAIDVHLTRPVRAGDGLVFEGGRLDGAEQGGRVYAVYRDGTTVTGEGAAGRVALAFGHGAIEPARLAPGQKVFKTDDPRLTARLRKTFTAADPIRRAPIDLHVTAVVGEPLRVRAAGPAGTAVEVVSEAPLEPATRHAATADLFREQLGRLGGSAYELRDLDVRVDGAPMVPLSVLGKLRRATVEGLDAAAAAPAKRTIDPAAARALFPPIPAEPREAAPLTLRPLVRSIDQLRDALDHGERSLLVDFGEIRGYGEAVGLARDARAEVFLATPRIHKPGETGVFLAMHKQAADGWLVRNLAGIDFCRDRGLRFVADFSLNAANPLTAATLREMGAERVTPSYDLNRDQLLELVQATPADWLEVVVHQHMPMFHMEHCVFCSLLSPGTNKTNCGRPCDRHTVKLRDRTGVEHPLTADVGCRNTLFNAVPQSAAEAVPALVAAGVRHFRVEVLEERGAALCGIIDSYRELLAGQASGKEVWRRLQASNRVGVTRGTMEERRNPLAIL